MNASLKVADSLRVFRDAHPIRTLRVGTDAWQYIAGGSASGIPIVIVSGAGAGVESMFSVNLALEPRSRVISLGIPASVVTAGHAADGIKAILDSLGLEKAILLGHSLGGMVVQAFTVRHPERVAGLILSNTGFYRGIRKNIVRYGAKFVSHLPDALLMSMITSQLKRLLKTAPAREEWRKFFNNELRQPGEMRRLKMQLHLMDDILHEFKAKPIGPTLPWIQSLPAQIIASEDDRGFTKRETAFLKSVYPNSQIVILPRGANHLSFVTRPEEYHEVVRRFIDRVQAGTHN